MKKDAYYFPHDANAKDDPKCVMLIEQLGMEGYGIYWMLIETLRDQPGYRYPMALLSALGRRFNTQTPKVEAVVLNYGLFKVEGENFFFSESLDKRMDAYDRKREKTSLAGQRSGEVRRQLASSANKSDEHRQSNESSTDVQQMFNGCLTSVEQEEKRRREKKRGEEKREDNIKDILSSRNRVDYDEFIKLYHSICTSLPRVEKISDPRKRAIKSALDAYGIDLIENAFTKVQYSDFLTGRDGKWYACGFDWILKPKNLDKIIEGNYDNKFNKTVKADFIHSSESGAIAEVRRILEASDEI